MEHSAVIRCAFLQVLLAMSLLLGAERARTAEPAPRPAPRKLIEFGWDEPDTAFLRNHIEEMERTPFNGCVFHVLYGKKEGGAGSFTWECWSRRAFTAEELKGALDDLQATPIRRFTENFLRFNTTPADVDWFDDFSAIIGNARLAARLAREGKCRGILFDIEQYGAPLFDYRLQRDAKSKSWDAYAGQVRKRGREVMEAFQEGFPGITVFLTFGYSLPWAQSEQGKKPLADCSYGLLAPLMDGMVEAAKEGAKVVDGHELSYGYRDRPQFAAASRTMKEDLLPLVADARKYREILSVGFGLWLDHDWRNKGWSETDPSKNYFTPEALEASVRSALDLADEYVWIYSETPRWWSPEGVPIKLPEAYGAALRRAGAKQSAALIVEAGNATDDESRLAILEELQRTGGFEGTLRGELDRLVAECRRYGDGKQLSYFGRTVEQKLDYDFGIREGSPLYPLTYLYRGRMVTWYALESGSVWSIPAEKRKFLDTARGFFQEAVKAFPENKIARMYLGETLPPAKTHEAPVEAPAWASFQREGLDRLCDIIEWWIDHRMQESGEYGGGWGDDCEMWRGWVPALVGFHHPKIAAAQARLSSAILEQPYMKLGYTSHLYDVEHTAEDSADTITPMMHIDPENELWKQRSLRLAELMEELWTGRNERGFLQFKSTYFNSTEVDGDPRRACDTVYHPRAVQPALLCWQRTRDARLTKLFSSWMDTWVDAASRDERGKPQGILPTAIHWPDGRVGGLGENWWDPRNHGEYTLYLFPSAMDSMLHTLLLAHHMTGEQRYLEPIRSMAAARLRFLEAKPAAEPVPGTEAWCAARLGSLSRVAAKYRLLTGGFEFDALLEREKPPYLAFRLGGEKKTLAGALRRSAEALRVNFPGFTSEVRYTDRVFRFPALFEENGMFPEGRPGIGSPDTSILYSTATGDPGEAQYFPLNAVRWLTPPRDIAALVTDSGKDRFSAELFHFGPEKREMAAELYLLEPGTYGLRLSSGDDILLSEPELRFQAATNRISFSLPPRRLAELTISKQP